MNNFEIYGVKNLEKINTERLTEINKISFYENKIYEEKNLPNAPFFFDQTIRSYNILEDRIKYKASSKTYSFQNDIEKTIFICNAIFLDNKRFLDSLYKCNTLNLLSEIVKFNNYLEERYEDKPSLIKLQKNNFYRSIIVKNKEQLKNTINYFYKFHKVSDLNVIVNKLSQIIYFDNEFYNTYINDIENEQSKTISKVKKG